MKLLKKLTLSLCLLPITAFAAPATYEVTVTNITKGMNFTPLLGVAHPRSVSLFQIGEPASESLAALAEGGAVAPLMEDLAGVASTAASEGLLAPGASTTFTLTADHPGLSFSLASMLLPTNDTFLAINGFRLPYYGSRTYVAKAFDAGSETNDELCANIPGPTCGGAPLSPEDAGEGYVFPSPGVHGEADLSRSEYQFAGPVAKVVVKRVN